MVNEYFSDVNRLDLYIKFKHKDRDKQHMRANAKAVQKIAAVSKGLSKNDVDNDSGQVLPQTLERKRAKFNKMHDFVNLQTKIADI